MHPPGLHGSAVLVVVGVFPKLDDTKEGEPGVEARGTLVGQFKRNSEFSIDFGRDLVGHPTRMEDGIEPVVVWHLGLAELGACRGTYGLPSAFDKTVE